MRSARPADIPRFVSLDDHVIEPPDVWTSRLPEPATATSGPAWRSSRSAPRCSTAASSRSARDRRSARLVLALRGPVHVGEAAVDRGRLPRARPSPSAASATTRSAPGCWQPGPRLDDMDANWTEASLCFPNFPRFCGQTFAEAADKELALLCVQRVQRLDGRGVVRRLRRPAPPPVPRPLVGRRPRRRRGRAQRGARRARAIAFSEIPAFLGLPSVHSGYWDRFFATCAATETVAVPAHRVGHEDAAHLRRRARRRERDAWASATASARSPTSSSPACSSATPSCASSTPRARSAGSRSSSSAPTTCGRRTAAGPPTGSTVPQPPSSYYYRQVYGCFFKDFHGVESLARVGVDNVTFETDYPHADSTWPHTKKLAEEMFAGLDAETVHKVVRGNAIRLLGLDLT